MSAAVAPLIVLDVASDADLAATARTLARAGWRLHHGFGDLPLSTVGLVCRGVVFSDDEAVAAVLAATWGAGLLVAAGEAPDETRERLIDDLARIGGVTRDSPPMPALHPDAERLLELLAAGSSLAAAAKASHLSRRTADRRLAEARRALAAGSTSEAIARWLAAAALLTPRPEVSERRST